MCQRGWHKPRQAPPWKASPFPSIRFPMGRSSISSRPAAHPPPASKVATNPAIALLAVLGGKPPAHVVVNEFTTVASVVTATQFIDGTALKASAALPCGSPPATLLHFADIATGGLWHYHPGPAEQFPDNDFGRLATLADLPRGDATKGRILGRHRQQEYNPLDMARSRSQGRSSSPLISRIGLGCHHWRLQHGDALSGKPSRQGRRDHGQLRPAGWSPSIASATPGSPTPLAPSAASGRRWRWSGTWCRSNLEEHFAFASKADDRGQAVDRPGMNS